MLVGDEPFIAGVSSDRAEMWERSLHADYTGTDSYKALFHAGLLLTSATEIDVLVTGLPVSQYQDESRRKALEKQFTGKRKITPKRTVEAASVKVVAQPIGGLFDMVNQDESQGEDGDIDEEARILVVDPGFFSLDWVLVSNGEFHRQSSDTSLKASSVLLEQAGLLIAQDYGAKPTVEALENAVRAGITSILMMGQRVDFGPYLKRAGESMSSTIANSIQKSLRNEKMSPDIVVLTGGGADFFRDIIQDAFPRLKVVSPKESVLSNARGFWLLGSIN
ncbi:ParM/StbA family protein [Acidovorax delafieldii]|nr:ParM/StbA family protein [Acidovorax delafieldii]